MLQKVPYELLELFFEHLDRASLLNAVLVNHTFNDAASPALYSNVPIEIVSYSRWDGPTLLKFGRNPFQAFDRKPGLRNAVRDVALTHQYDYYDSTEAVEVEALCHKEFSFFSNIRSLSIDDQLSSEWARFGFLWQMIQDIQTVRVLKLADLLNIEGISFHNVKGFECNLLSPTDMKIKIYANRVHKLSFWLSDTDMDVFKSFLNLKELNLGGVAFPLQGINISALASLPELTHLQLGLVVKKINSDDLHDYQPTGLTRLAHLTICFDRWFSTFIDYSIYWLVKSIAGRAHLASLVIASRSRRQTVSRCERLLHHIWVIHGKTLQRLKLPFFNISRILLCRISNHIPNLVELWIEFTPQMKTWIPDVLSTFTRLEHLRLYHIGRIDFPYSSSFLQQVCPTLTVLKFCQRNRFYTPVYGTRRDLKYIWKTNWLYDEQLGFMRRIQGPKTVGRVNRDVAWDYRKCHYASDSD